MSSVVTVAEVDPGQLNRFLAANFGPAKTAFLDRHGEWWHRGQENRWVVVEEGEILGYCSTIPTRFRIGEKTNEAVWWVDLVVDRKHRGKGLQTILDERIRMSAPLVIGFPNALAARIHRRHRWNVREDLEVRLLPLRPREMARARAVGAVQGTAFFLASILAEPWARLSRYRLAKYEPCLSRTVDDPDSMTMARIFDDFQPRDSVTTLRDQEYLQRRYLDAPYRDQLIFISGGDERAPRVMMVLRVIENGSPIVARILDLFGDIGAGEIVGDMLGLAARVSLDRGAAQVTALSSDPAQTALLRRAGFVVYSKARFCWLAAISGESLDTPPLYHHLVLGDSDHDEP